MTSGATASIGAALDGSNATIRIPAAQSSTQSCDTRMAPRRAMK